MSEAGRDGGGGSTRESDPKEACGSVFDEVGVGALDREVAASVTDFGSDVVWAGQVAWCLSAGVVDDQDTLSRAAFEPDEAVAVGVEGNSIETAAGGDDCRGQGTGPTSVLSGSLCHDLDSDHWGSHRQTRLAVCGVILAACCGVSGYN